MIYKLATYADPTIDRQFSDIERALKPLTGSGAPSGTVTPRWLGDQYFDTAAALWYVSTGTSVTAWQVVGSGGGGGTSDHESLTGLQGGTTGQHVHLTDYEYRSVVDQLGRVESIAPTPGTPYVVSNVVEGIGNINHRYYNQLFLLNGLFSGSDSSYIQLNSTRETDGERIRFIDGANGPQLIVFPADDQVRYAGTLTTITSWSSPSIGWNYNSTTAQYGFKTAGQTIGDCVEVMCVGNSVWTLIQYDFQSWVNGSLPWGKVDKTGAVASDVGAIADAPSDGTTYGRNNGAWVAAGGGGGGSKQAFTATFAGEDTSQQVTVTNAAISTTSAIIGTVDSEEAGILQMQVNVVSKGTGTCDIIVVAPNGATGTYSGFISII